MNWNVSAETQVQPHSSEIERPAHVWEVSQRMPNEIHQFKPKLRALKHHAKTFQVVQFKPNDIKSKRLRGLSNW